MAIDPSGNFTEGKGVSGWCLMTSTLEILETSMIEARNYKTKEDYWGAHVQLLIDMSKKYKNLIVVIEDYVLYPHKLTAQICSRMETPKVIGIMERALAILKLPSHLELASTVKRTYDDETLNYLGIIKTITKGNGKHHYINGGKTRIIKHQLDSIRHAAYYARKLNGRK